MGIQKEVIDLMAEKLSLKTENIKPESHFIRDLKADSLDLVDLIMSLEEKFNIQIPDEEAEKMESVKELIDYIQGVKS